MGILALFVVAGLLLAAWSATHVVSAARDSHREAGTLEGASAPTNHWPAASASSDDSAYQPAWDSAPILDFGSPATHYATIGDVQDVNPATSLPMIGGIGGIDAGGSVYGTASTASFDDFGSSLSTSIHDFHSSSESFMSMDASPFSSDPFSSFSSMGHNW